MTELSSLPPIAKLADAECARPSTPAERIEVIDVLRGFALFGILTVNMTLFSLPIEALWLDTAWWTNSIDWATAVGIRFFAEGKFYVLFSFLFGLGMALQMERLTARGQPFVRLYVRRLLALLIVGLCHAIFFWWGDILVTYALLGFVLLLLQRCSSMVLALLIVNVLVLTLVGGAVYKAVYLHWLHASFSEARLEEHYASLPETIRAMAVHAVEICQRSSFVELIGVRMRENRETLFWLLDIWPNVFMMFLLGVLAVRQRVLPDVARHRPLFIGLAITALPIGLGLNAARVILWESCLTFRPTWLNFWLDALAVVGSPILAAGYMGVLVLLAQTGVGAALLRPLAATGRMALTNYLTQTLICTTLFYGYGCGLFGQVGALGGLLLAVVIYAVQVAWSNVWLTYIRYGPLEWVWRALTYARWPEMRPPRAGLPPPTQGIVS